MILQIKTDAGDSLRKGQAHPPGVASVLVILVLSHPCSAG